MEARRCTSQLSIEVGKGVEAMGVVEAMEAVEATLILAVATLYLAVVTRGVRADQLVPGPQCSSRSLKERGVRLLQKVCRRAGTLLIVGRQITQP